MDKIASLISNRFSDLRFEEVGHRYSVQNDDLTPVSDVIKNFYEPFNSKEQSELFAKRHGGKAEDIAAAWKLNGDNACDIGRTTHKFGEDYFYDKTLKPNTLLEQAIVEFWNDLPDSIIPVLPERTMYSKKYRYAGTCDILFYDKFTKGLIIADYKTNLNIFKNYKGKKMLAPFDHLLDSPINHYQLQLSMYQIPLEDIGISVTERWIVWLKRDGTYERYETIDYTKELRQQLLNQTPNLHHV